MKIQMKQKQTVSSIECLCSLMCYFCLLFFFFGFSFYIRVWLIHSGLFCQYDWMFCFKTYFQFNAFFCCLWFEIEKINHQNTPMFRFVSFCFILFVVDCEGRVIVIKQNGNFVLVKYGGMILVYQIGLVRNIQNLIKKIMDQHQRCIQYL